MAREELLEHRPKQEGAAGFERDFVDLHRYMHARART